MLSNEDEVLLEQYISNRNMSKEERDIFVNLILHTKEICDGDIKVFDNDKTSYDLVNLNLAKDKNGIIMFNGCVSNGMEFRLLDGYIKGGIDKNNDLNYSVVNNMYRFNEYLDDEEKYIHTLDMISTSGSKAVRKTYYENLDGMDSKPRSFIKLFNKEELEKYYLNMIYPNNMKKELK